MRSGDTFIAQSTKWTLLIAICCLLLTIFGGSAYVSAVGKPVQAKIDNGDINPALSVTNITSPHTITTMPLEIHGTLDSLTQIQVYIDGVFSVTVPIDSGAMSFSTNLVITAGTHQIKLAGISPFADVSPVVVLQVTYIPPQTPGQEQGSVSAPDPTINLNSGSSSGSGGATIGHDGAISTTYVDPVEVTSLPGWLYSGLLAIDIARPGGTDEQIITMLQRLTVLAMGAILLVFARPVLYGWCFIRYQWFGLKMCKLRACSRYSPWLPFRIIGFMLIFSIFSFS